MENTFLCIILYIESYWNTMHLCVFIYLENTLYLESFDERAETLHMTLDVGAGLLFPAHVAPEHLKKHKLFPNHLSIGLHQVSQDSQ